MYYCEDHDSLMLTQDYEDRLVITGLKPGTVLKFAQEIVKKSLEKEVEKTKKHQKETWAEAKTKWPWNKIFKGDNND